MNFECAHVHLEFTWSVVTQSVASSFHSCGDRHLQRHSSWKRFRHRRRKAVVRLAAQNLPASQLTSEMGLQTRLKTASVGGKTPVLRQWKREKYNMGRGCTWCLDISCFW